MKPFALVRASHPGPALTVTLVGAGLAAASGRDAWSVASVLVAVGLGQLSIAWSNDGFDAARDASNERLDKPVATGEISRRFVLWLAVAAAAGSVAASLYLWPVGLWHVFAVASAWLYNHPLKRTALSVLPYAVSFGLLVAYADADPEPGMIVAGATLGAAAHFANVLPDLDDDARTGIRGLPHRLGARGSQASAAVLLLAAGVTAGFHTDTIAGPAIMAISVGFALAVLLLRPGRTVFRLVMVAALVDVVALLTAAAS